jgi:tetratricopeptide (TPR) repeat protein
MLKSTICVAIISIFLGLLAGAHVPHIRVHQAVRELYSRKCGIDRETCNSAFEAFMSRRAKTLALGGVLETLDGACDNCLEFLWFPRPNSIKAASYAQLYQISTFEEAYWLARELVFCAQKNRHYCECRERARMAMAVRGSGELHNTSRETRFAESLIYFGMYSDAESVLKNLLPVEMTIGESDAPKPFRHYRQELLAEALLGQQKYQEAADVLEQSLPEETDFDSLIYLRGIALLALHRDKEALELFKSQKNDCQNFFIDLCSPALVDKARKDKVMKLTVKYSSDTIGASDDVPCLELAVHILQRKGFDEAAAQIANDIHVLTQN